MTDTRTPAAYSACTRQLLVGQSITSVSYHCLDFEGEELCIDADPRFDSIDMGIVLHLTDGQHIALTWGSEFGWYGVSIDPMIWQEAIANWDGLFIDATHHPHWQAAIAKLIVTADYHWIKVDETTTAGKLISSTYCPLDLQLTFDDGSTVIIAALEIRDDGWHLGLMDHITIFSDPGIATQFGCLQSDLP